MKKAKIDKRKIFKIIVMIYFMISPVFDVIYFYNHLTTLFRVSCLLIFVTITVTLYKESRKTLLFLVAYYLSLLGYLVVSYFHSKGFYSIAPNVSFNLLSEAMTLLKLSMPFTILFVLKYQDFDRKDFFRVVNVWIILIGGSIVLLNICGLSLASYTGEFTNYSIFSWRKGMDMRLTATKGLFAYTNQEVAILLMLLVLAIYEFIKIDKKSIILISIVSLSLIMLGSRISTYGGLAVLVFVILLYLGYNLAFKKKISKSVLWLTPIVIFWIVILPISPNSFRVQEIENATKNKESNDQRILSDSDEDLKFKEELEFIDNSINKNLIGEQFYRDFYPYQYDTEFWKDVVAKQNEMKLDYRKIETMIVQRVWEIDGRKTNILFGISNSRIQSMMNVERDFVLHFYAFGIIGGLIALLFYLFALGHLTLVSIREKSFMNLTIALCFCLFVISAFLSGNILNFMGPIIPCAFIVNSIGKYKDC